ncbi:MAG: alanine racemase, partial [Firmicutes bacterium]|nr:alanine racemase [Bacillota bacterium]
MIQKAIIENIATLRAELLRHARDPMHPPVLLPVTKTRPVSDILALRAAGVTAVGENRTQEIVEKYPAISGDFAIQFIGRLQTNKIKYIISRVCMVQSLDRPELAEALDGRAQAMGKRMPVLVEVNIGG